MAGKRTKEEKDTRYHDTWRLLKKYRDVVWSMELSVQQVKKEFETEFGSTIDDFLESVYLAGADLGGTKIENHARCIERSNQMLKLLDNAMELLRTRHKNGEAYYWLLYYTFLSPPQMDNVEEIVEQLQPHIRDIRRATYFRKRGQAVEALSSIFWGYSSKDSMAMLADFSLMWKQKFNFSTFYFTVRRNGDDFEIDIGFRICYTKYAQNCNHK